MESPLFESIRAERASGRVTTVHDWLAEHPPPAHALRQTVAAIAERVLAGEPFMLAVREFLDELKLRSTTESRAGAIAAAPPSTGDTRHDAFLGALAEHVAATYDLDIPRWTQDPGRFTNTFWFVSDVKAFRATAIAQSPAAFRRRGIFIAAATLERC